jgi:hypothetical protein
MDKVDPPTQPTASTKGQQLAGMDKVDYTALIELARRKGPLICRSKQNFSNSSWASQSIEIMVLSLILILTNNRQANWRELPSIFHRSERS